MQAGLDQRQMLELHEGASLVSLADMGDDDKADHLRVDPRSEQLTYYLEVNVPRWKPEGPTANLNKLRIVADGAGEGSLVLF